MSDNDNLAQQLQSRIQGVGGLDCGITSLRMANMPGTITDKFVIMVDAAEESLIQEMSSPDYERIHSLLLANSGILWVTSCKNPSGAIQGLSRVLAFEKPAAPVVSLTLGEHGHEEVVQSILYVFLNTIHGVTISGHEPEYVEVDGILNINRLVEADDLDHHMSIHSSEQESRVQDFGVGPPLKLTVGALGLLDTLGFVEDMDYAQPLDPGQVEVEVMAIGVNLMDCLVALGRVDGDSFGSECSGVVRRVGEACADVKTGDRVSVCHIDAYRSYVRSSVQCVVRLPDDMSYAEAAAIPTNFVTAFHGIVEVAQIKEGESVLIHAGAGGTGQAAIQISQCFGAEIYVTVGSEKKKRLIMDQYHIAEDRIMYSRDLSFAKAIKLLTQGRGVDVVFNSLAGESLIASWECLAPYGRFIEIGKRDIYSNRKLPMFPFAKNVSFSAVDLAAMTFERPWLIQNSIRKVMQLFAAKRLHTALPLQRYSISEIEHAFRLLQSGTSSGKLVIEVQSSHQVPASCYIVSLDVRPSVRFDEKATYIVTGGLGGLGRSIARWMTEPAKSLLEEFRVQEVQTYAPCCNIADRRSLADVLDLCSRMMPPIKGCIQAAMDTVFEKMPFSDWQASTDPKIKGSWNLHLLLPKGLDFFVLLSSVCGIIGNAGQANYAAGNTYQDSLARHRVCLGEKAISLDLGIILSEGFVAADEDMMKRLTRKGDLFPLSLDELNVQLDYYCNPTLPVLAPNKSQLVTGIKIPPAIPMNGRGSVPWVDRPLFRHLHQMEARRESLSSTAATAQAINLSTAFQKAGSAQEAGDVVTQALVKKLAMILSIPTENIDILRPMHAYGVDSLVGIELRNWFAKELGAEVAIFEILGGRTLAAIGEIVAEK
ncbi:MAG: hypothetical protein Q9167_006999, partial [Letrouitia subvulpina]